MRAELGIVVYAVKPGYGCTNTGPVAKKFFDFPEKVSSQSLFFKSEFLKLIYVFKKVFTYSK